MEARCFWQEIQSSSFTTLHDEDWLSSLNSMEHLFMSLKWLVTKKYVKSSRQLVTTIMITWSDVQTSGTFSLSNSWMWSKSLTGHRLWAQILTKTQDLTLSLQLDADMASSLLLKTWSISLSTPRSMVTTAFWDGELLNLLIRTLQVSRFKKETTSHLSKRATLPFRQRTSKSCTSISTSKSIILTQYRL